MAARRFLQRDSAPDQFVRTKLSQLEVPEALRTIRLSGGPRYQRGGQSSVSFPIVNGFFQISSQIFLFPASARFPERASTISGPARGSTGFSKIFFQESPAVISAPIQPARRCTNIPSAMVRRGLIESAAPLAKASLHVVVHHAGGLHVRIADGRTHEGEAHAS